ncbi:MAG: sensor histidine kinase [Sulfurovum sp.]|uniref:sensor histidine kinase n=1 Tax=Sulfurovum sp. TaxID=1969726 RepID=UPI002867E9E0|nr:sensor histidine kinase [Sulfurovum sp.]MCO4844865.1 sensor histidine kinase [Sulfurovum sp.]
MNFFESEILKGKYFIPKSRDRLRATMVNLFILAGAFVMLLYAYENLVQGYYMMLSVELFIIFILMVAYLVFPHYVNINHTSYMILGALTFLLSMSLIVPDQDPELSLFWLAALPIFVFFFLGVKKGIRWSTNMFIVLLFIPLFSYLTGVQFVYEWELLSQIVLGYLVVSYMLYIIESERSSYEERLNVALEENKILFKEVHHRTKNNMQVVMSLLESQSFKIDDPKYKKMFETHVDRLKAMSLMHKNLYSNHSYEEVDIQEYLEEIAQSLQTYTEYSISTVIDPLIIDMKIAMNLGLIFNEAVTNAIEHAFDTDEGDIDISFKQLGERYSLCIQDNGKGFDTSKTYKSLGLTLIKDLSVTLPHSTINIEGLNGTKIEIHFDKEEHA